MLLIQHSLVLLANVDYRASGDREQGARDDQTANIDSSERQGFLVMSTAGRTLRCSLLVIEPVQGRGNVIAN